MQLTSIRTKPTADVHASVTHMLAHAHRCTYSANLLQKLTAAGGAAMLAAEVRDMDLDPRYNIRAVERLTGVPAPTLRSWERRYGFPAPARTATARRLYSDADVRLIRWVRQKTESGLSAAQAIEWAQSGSTNQVQTAGADILPFPPDLVRVQVEATRRYDERAIETALTVAFAHYPADFVLMDVITPALVEVGDLWARGEIPVAAEHFFSNIIRRRLLALLAVQPAVAPRFSAALACLPGERHELGLLMLAIFLRWAGAEVLYLGADLPIQDVIRLIRAREIDAVCLSAGGEASLDAVDLLQKELPDTAGAPCLYLGGAAADRYRGSNRVRVLALPLPEAAAAIIAGVKQPAP